MFRKGEISVKTLQSKREISMKNLDLVRVRHTMLLGVHNQMKNYLECLERGYLGNMTEKEKEFTDELKQTMLKIENACWDYFEEEGRILGE